MRRGMVWLCLFAHGLSWSASSPSSATAAETPLASEARRALLQGVEFFHKEVSSHGGYVYLYSADLAKREGEGKTTIDQLWVQPPGTPAVGEVFVHAYNRTGEPSCLAAARDAAECLIQGQYRSGGWNGGIEFDPKERSRQAYRVDPIPKNKRQRNTSSLDDDKTQSALRFLMQLDHALKFQDERIHEATMFALDALLEAQYPNGAWAQIWDGPITPNQPANRKASFPDDWPRKYPGGDYWYFYTFNDGNIDMAIKTLLLASEVYGDPKYRAAALRAGDFILLAQLPEPQPAWAQQYNFEMHPVWARKFEPAAVSGGESQNLINTLMDLYVETGDRKFLEPIRPALDYLRMSQLPDGRLARFYELKTNRPLYMTREYVLTYNDDDLPTHYGFQIDSKVEKLTARFNKLKVLKPDEVAALRANPSPRRVSSNFEAEIRRIISSQDQRGAWVEDGKLKYHGKSDDTRRIISSESFIEHLDQLSQYLEAVGNSP